MVETSPLAFRQNPGEMLSRVRYGRDSIVINQDGKPVAALVNVRLFEQNRRMQARFDALCRRIDVGFAAIDEKSGLAEMAAAVELVTAKARSEAKRR